MSIKDKIRVVESSSKEGMNFKDITTLIGDGEGLKETIDTIVNELKDKNIDVIVGPEARGFLFGVPVAYALGVGFVPIRKPGKLPCEILSMSYDSKGERKTLEMHKDAIKKGQRVAIVDDLLAKGDTVATSIKLIEEAGGEVASLNFVIELTMLKGREKLKNYEVSSLVKYDSCYKHRKL